MEKKGHHLLWAFKKMCEFTVNFFEIILQNLYLKKKQNEVLLH